MSADKAQMEHKALILQPLKAKVWQQRPLQSRGIQIMEDLRLLGPGRSLQRCDGRTGFEIGAWFLALLWSLSTLRSMQPLRDWASPQRCQFSRVWYEGRYGGRGFWRLEFSSYGSH